MDQYEQWLKEQDENEKKIDEENERKMKDMPLHEREEFEREIKHHKEEVATHKGRLWIEAKHKVDCEYDPKTDSPFASCRLKHPPIEKF
jgi:hypothetical protein